MSKRKIIVGTVVIVVLTVGTVWALRGGSDPQVEKVKQMQAELFKPDMKPEERREAFQQVRQEMEQLAPEQRDAIRADMRQTFERRMDERIAAYFALPKEERAAAMDKQIKEMEQRRKEMEARRTQQGQPGSPSGAGGQASAGGPGNGGPGGGGRQGQARTPEERAARRDQRLDRSTPEQRAMRAAYMSDMQKRRSELGLPPRPSRGPR